MKDITAKICKFANTPNGIPRTGINKAATMFVIQTSFGLYLNQIMQLQLKTIFDFLYEHES